VFTEFCISLIPLLQYKKQQRKLQFCLKQTQEEFTAVLTIDQCQGQEADVVIISLVRKPTKFLNKNRLNVALSRVHKELYLLADKDALREASRWTDWGCNRLAEDLLEMAK